ncbi:unnamed protein product [Effrenium voratum]|nr:unnamed protein product [Effrenium voratum]
MACAEICVETITCDQTTASQAFTNLQLSYRGAERQAPSVLTLALTFSHVMAWKADRGLHSPEMNTEERLRAVVNEFNGGTIAKWHTDDDKFKAVLNLLIGSSPEARQVIANHLNYHKWTQSAFTSELLRSTRWLLGATCKNGTAYIKNILTVTHESQVDMLRGYVAWFNHQTRRVKAASRAKLRLDTKEWERLVDYSCVMTAIRNEAGKVHSGERLAEMQSMLHTAFMARDYYAEILASLDSALTNWNVRHLTLWGELVEVQAPESVPTEADMEAMEEATLAAQFQEVRSKISMDELAWVRYKNQEKKKLAREHIIAVTHGKAQNDIGKGLVEGYMEKMCCINLVPDSSSVPNLDAWIRQAAGELKVKQDELLTVVVTDYSKLGSAALIVAPLLAGASAGGSLRRDYRNIEDKVVQHRMELRDLRLGLDMGGLHGNTDRPGYFQAWLAVPDAFLPLKGTGHRVSRADDKEQLKAAKVSDFAASELWRLQGFAADSLPSALPEASFVVPSARATLSGNESRKNFTDVQETAQWLAGEEAYCKVLKSLFRFKLKRAVVIHTTAYCGSLERACVQLGVPVWSLTDNSVCHSYAAMTVANMLLQAGPLQ